MKASIVAFALTLGANSIHFQDDFVIASYDDDAKKYSSSEPIVEVLTYYTFFSDRISGDRFEIVFRKIKCSLSVKKPYYKIVLKKNGGYYSTVDTCKSSDILPEIDYIFIEKIDVSMTGRGRVIVNIPIRSSNCISEAKENFDGNGHVDIAFVPNRKGKAEPIFNWHLCT